MSNISLRAYTREIDSIIDRGRIQEAIAHCRHILSKFPKHIDTYRLLGKAYLESNQNSNAADIFQRVLSAVPDDFVSHIGMSLIREEEGNLHSAVKHMERAFERQPYNNAIQEEIRRLYGKRDGIEPPKVRLTQGALARMYIKGGLIQQGIAELRSALAENPDRFDLRTLLADAYEQANQMGKAIETASVILKKFPFNLTANRILAHTLKTHDHPEEMAICRKRLYALSPYEAYVSEHAPTVEQVPDQAITLEKIDWDEVQGEYEAVPAGTEVDWSSALSEEPAGEAEEEPVPDWLAGVSDEEIPEIAEQAPEAEGPTADSLEEERQASEAFEAFEEEEPVPDWLAGISEEDEEDAGEGVPELEETPESVLEDAKDQITQETEAELAEDETELASIEDEEMPEPFEELDQEEEVPDWLTEVTGDEREEESTPIPEAAEPAQEEPTPELEDELPQPVDEEEIIGEDDQVPDWLAEAPEDAETQQVSQPPEGEIIPEESQPEAGPAEETLTSPTSEVEEEMEALEEEDLEPEDFEDESIPAWMAEAGWEASQGEPGEPQDIYDEEYEQEEEELEPAEIPDWLQERTPPEMTEPAEDAADEPVREQELPMGMEEDEAEPAAAPEAEEDLPDWLLSEKEPPLEAEAQTEEPPAAEEPPAVEREGKQPSAIDIPEPEGEPQEAGEFPDWLKDIKSDEEEQDTTVAWLNNLPPEEDISDEDLAEFEGEGFPSSEVADELDEEMVEPEWIKEMKKEEQERTPDWLREAQDKTTPAVSEEETPPPVETPMEEETPPKAEMWEDEPESFEEDPISTFEKGEGLVADELEDEEEDAFPDWLTELEKEEEEAARAEEEQAADMEADWFEREVDEEPVAEEPTEIDAQQPPTAAEPSAAPEGEIPSWLQELEEEPAAEDSAPAQDTLEDDEEVVQDEGALPDWLVELEEGEAAVEPPASEDEVETEAIDTSFETPPAAEIEQEEGPEEEVEAQAPAQPDFADDDETMAWLESLAEKQGADEEGFVTSAEDREQIRERQLEEDTADEVPTDAGPEAAELEEEQLSQADMPDWLAELEPEDEVQAPAADEPTVDAEQISEVEPAEAQEEPVPDQEDLPAWLDKISPSEEVFQEDIAPDGTQEETEDIAEFDVEPEAPVEDVEDEGIPSWLGELETAEEDLDTPDTLEDEIDLSHEAEEGEEQPFPSHISKDDTGDLAWLESLVDSEEEQPTEDQVDQKAPQPEAEESDLPDWLLELEREKEADIQEDAEDQDRDIESGAESAQTDWLAEFEEAEEEAKDFIGAEIDDQDPGEPAAGENGGEISEQPPSEGMLKRLGELEKEEEEAHDELPDWLADFKEEEDPQETAVLWLRRFIEQKGDVDLEAELRKYTDNLEDDQIPEWIEDLQKEEDPTSTAMLWLERLERDEGVPAPEREPGDEVSDESDWLAELEREEKGGKPSEPVRGDEDFDMDEEGWLADLEHEEILDSEEQEQKPAFASEDQDEEETPPWMLATSPLEGDLLTGELMGAEEEDIPDWLAGYEEEDYEEQAQEEAAEESESDEYAWMSAYADKDSVPPEEKIDLNEAAISQLESIIGISYHTAEGIVAYREKHGPFKDFESLRDVPEVENDQVVEILKTELALSIPEVEPEEKIADQDEIAAETETTEAPDKERDSQLDQARKKISAGEIDEALKIYEQMIDDKVDIEQVIDDLSDASYDHPMNVSIIKTLGDAYMSIDKLQEALDAYSKAEDLLR